MGFIEYNLSISSLLLKKQGIECNEILDLKEL